MRPSSLRVHNQIYSGDATRGGERIVPEECPIAFTYERQTYAVMLATPDDLEDFAVGFSLSEEIVSNATEIENLEILDGELGIELRMDIRADSKAHYHRRRRLFAGVTGCGLCGLESLTEVSRMPPKVTSELVLSPAMIAGAVESLAPAQVLNKTTSAVHAAGFWTPETGLVALREDVGRHNALDKLAGALARGGRNGHSGVVLLTSRVSVEMVQKTARLGAGILVAVSAPTALAIRTAEQCGISLVAVARGTEFEIFSHPRRIAGGVVCRAG